MKKLVFFLMLCVALVAVLCACGGDADKKPSVTTLGTTLGTTAPITSLAGVVTTAPATTPNMTAIETTPVTTPKVSVADTTPITTPKVTVAETTPATTPKVTQAETTPATTPKVTSADTTAKQTTPSVTTPTTPETTEAPMVYDRYDVNTYMQPIWEGNTIYNETVMFVGKDDKASLLYTPDKILSVRSPDLKKEYQEGVDYRLENGKLVLCDNTSIPYFKNGEYYLSSPHPQGSFGCTVPGHPYIRFQEGSFFHGYQIAVTYTHSDTWEGYIPEGQSDKLPKTLAKLQNNEAIKILFYGDSITEGYNASAFVNAAPYADTWSKMLTDYLGIYFGNKNIEYINTGLAGKDSTWAIQNLQQRVLDYAPDLVVLAFGMNDGGIDATTQTSRTKRIVNFIQSKLPDTEVVVVSTMLPNKEVAGFWGNQSTFEAAYLTAMPDVAVARMTSVHTELLKHKAYYHMTGNNVNHPNDFLCRVYAQTIFQTIVGK